MKSILLLLAGSATFAQTVSISTPAQSVASAYVRLEGTSSGVVLPMWYEVFDANGKMTDYGAFKNRDKWFCVVRHLSAGLNKVVLHGAASPASVAKDTVILKLEVGAKPSVRPRPIPAEVWWGGTADNDQLRTSPGQWVFVKKYADAYFMHTAAWRPGPTLTSVVEQLDPYGAKLVAELGGGTGARASWPADQFKQWGSGGYLNGIYKTSGVILSEATHDFQPNVKAFADSFPAWSDKQIVDTLVSYWKQYFQLNNAVFPHLKQAHTQSPVWWDWNTYKALGGVNNQGYVFTSNGVKHDIDFADIMAGLRRAASQTPDHREWAFYSDLPYDFANTTQWAPYDGAHLRAKTIAYESWLHSVGARHTRVVNWGVKAAECADLDLLHRNFATKSLEELQQHQLEGGRADRYNFESWYRCGDSIGWVPTRVVGEDVPYTYTWLAKQGIKFVKGIRDTTGTLEKLSLTKTTTGSSTVFSLRNDGDVACLPNLQNIETGDASVATRWFDAANADITAKIKTPGGWVDSKLLPPGAALTVRCVVSGTGNKEIDLEAFWNPQDPTGIVRARESILVGHLVGVVPEKDGIAKTGPREVDLYRNDGRRIGTFGWDGRSIVSKQALPQGVYLVRASEAVVGASLPDRIFVSGKVD